jgi:hypothetical protein
MNTGEPVVSIVFPVPPPPEPRPIMYRESPSLERIERLEAEVSELKQIVTEIQQQQQVSRPRRRWYQRLTVETWGDDNQA